MSMQKRGQVTFFIVLGVFIMFSLIFLSLLATPKKEEAFAPVDRIVNYVDECMRKTVNNGVMLTAASGGFYRLPEKYAEPWKVPYFYGPNTVDFSQIVWENELGNYLESNLDACIQSFWFFAVEGVEIEQGEKRANVMIRRENILVTLSYPLTITMGEVTRNVNEFSVVIPVRLLPLIKAVGEWNKQDKNELCLSCLFELGQEYNLIIRVYPDENRNLFYEFIDLNNIINKEYLVFSFAEQY